MSSIFSDPAWTVVPGVLTTVAVSVPAYFAIADRRRRKYPTVDATMSSVLPNVKLLDLTIVNFDESSLTLVDLQIIDSHGVKICGESHMQERVGPNFRFGSRDYDFENSPYGERATFNDKLGRAGSFREHFGARPGSTFLPADSVEIAVYISLAQDQKPPTIKFVLNSIRNENKPRQIAVNFSVPVGPD